MSRVRTVLRAVSIIILLAAAPLGCAVEYSARSLGVPVTMTPASAPADSFTVTTRAVHLFWGLAPVREPSLQHVLANQLGPGTGVSNLTIRSRKKWSDVLVSILTAGFVSTTAVTFQGVVIQQRSP